MTLPKILKPEGDDKRNFMAKLCDGVKTGVKALILFLSIAGALHIYSLVSGYQLKVTNVQAISPIGE